MEKFSQEMLKKNMTFTYLTILPDDASLSALTLDLSTNSTGETCINTSKNVDAAHVGNKAEDVPTNLKRDNASDLTVPRAIEELKNLTPIGEELVTDLKGPPLFMFSTTPGRYSDVQIFYDTGNSHVLFKEGTPQNLYGVKY